jgi:hypothetical protein
MYEEYLPALFLTGFAIMAALLLIGMCLQMYSDR